MTPQRTLSLVVAAAFCAGIWGCGDDANNIAGSFPDPVVDAGTESSTDAATEDPVLKLDSGTEICDGLDNDENGAIDEGCSCNDGETQPCYPLDTPPPQGCGWGEQACVAGSWSTCHDATLPPEGEVACCTALGANPQHEVYDAFLQAYPPSGMPQTAAAVVAFAPATESYTMKWSQANKGNELVDYKSGGIKDDNVKAGRELARQKALATLPAGSKLVDTKEGDVQSIVLGGSGTCNGVAWAWGSLLAEAPDQSVSEIVYLYVGFCAGSKDAEAFFYSDEPVQVCQPPRTPA